jgi:hypothetical protein
MDATTAPANVLPFPARPAPAVVVAIEPARSLRELAALRPADADFMPAHLALILLQGWVEEAQYYRAKGWRELEAITIVRVEQMRTEGCAAPRIRKALETVRDSFAAKLREARA